MTTTQKAVADVSALFARRCSRNEYLSPFSAQLAGKMSLGPSRIRSPALHFPVSKPASARSTKTSRDTRCTAPRAPARARGGVCRAERSTEPTQRLTDKANGGQGERDSGSSGPCRRVSFDRRAESEAREIPTRVHSRRPSGARAETNDDRPERERAESSARESRRISRGLKLPSAICHQLSAHLRFVVSATRRNGFESRTCHLADANRWIARHLALFHMASH